MKRRGRPQHERILFVAGGFLEDPKIASLTDSELRAWLHILLDHVRYGNGPELPAHAYGVSRRRIERFRELGLLDVVEGRLEVHGWDRWNGAEAYRRLLARQRKRRQRGQPEE